MSPYLNALLLHTIAVVHADRTHPQGSPLIRARLDGTWPLRQRHPATIAGYLQPLQVLVAVAYRNTAAGQVLVIIDVRWITGFTLAPNNRVDFTTAAAPQFAHLIGTPSPAHWTPGDGWPMKVLRPTRRTNAHKVTQPAAEHDSREAA
ncbi:hypothetical protein [Angustibacter aerolatus]|nr:hypothetical protein [Angustibacter aerolatus]GMA89448.1 hypothetical protein GCM10025868_46980 [Angustibacter aerolatus]